MSRGTLDIRGIGVRTVYLPVYEYQNWNCRITERGQEHAV